MTDLESATEKMHAWCLDEIDRLLAEPHAPETDEGMRLLKLAAIVELYDQGTDDLTLAITRLMQDKGIVRKDIEQLSAVDILVLLETAVDAVN